VARLTLGKKKYAESEAQMQTILEQADALRAALTESVQRDAAAFEAWMAAIRLPKDTPEQEAGRTRAVQQAALHAAQVPLEVARKAVAVLELAVKVATLGNLNAISDAGSGTALARAALTSAGWNVQVNCLSLDDSPACTSLLNELHQLEAGAIELEAQVKQQLHVRGHLPL
jgi:formiminotetrahydrofolate cyclodeaminase